MNPFHSNPCGSDLGNFLQVKVTSDCDGICSWCVERQFGFTPPISSLAAMKAAIAITEKTDIVLMGGEPTLSPKLVPLLKIIDAVGKNAWIWTSGWSFGRLFSSCGKDLFDSPITGVTLSVHNFDLERNRCITGHVLREIALIAGVKRAGSLGIEVHLTCNVIAGEIDLEEKIRGYIQFAKRLGVSRVRFAELTTFDAVEFVGLHGVLGGCGLPRDPFTDGCQVVSEIDGMEVLLSLVCGFQTPERFAPDNCELSLNPVLYEDGVIREGWVTDEP